MKRSARHRKFVIVYLSLVAVLLLALIFTYKFSARKIRLELNSLFNTLRYNAALHTARNPIKQEWLKEWKEIEESWNKISYLVHVPYLMFQYTPNVRSPHLNTNDMGFRGKEDYSHLPSVAVDENYRYVVLLGGSAAFGAFSVSDEKSISGQLESMLNDAYKKGKPFKVINLSAGFYNSFQELIAYILYGLKFKPQVVITFDGFNDASVSSSIHESRRVPLVSGNYYYTKEVLDKINTGSLKTKRRASFLSSGDKNTSWDKESGDFINDVVALYRRNLDLICTLSRESNARVILTLQPVQVLKDGHMAWRYDRKDLEAAYRLLPEELQSLAAKHNAGFIDFQKVFRENKTYNDYFSHTDPVHLIDEGQRIVAGFMLEKIKALLPDE
ncbi:MAG: GDSL-type esterase/lipase family protein [Candidatus Omnitrophica bacterium]|nr:GDSL-type esterase/lipase family protein [Candidatus Omnitrophota bacterium]